MADVYKQKLRNASKSQGTQLTEADSETVTQPSISAEEITGNSTSTGIQTELTEIPVINMQDFESVNADDKLNLLMAAINKINTNMYLKFDFLKKVLADEKDGVLPQLK